MTKRVIRIELNSDNGEHREFIENIDYAVKRWGWCGVTETDAVVAIGCLTIRADLEFYFEEWRKQFELQQEGKRAASSVPSTRQMMEIEKAGMVGK